MFCIVCVPFTHITCVLYSVCPIHTYYMYFVIAKDFNLSGNRVVSCGMDHSLKIWSLETSSIIDIVDQSKKFLNTHDKL